MYVPWAYPGYRLQHNLPILEVAKSSGKLHHRSLQAAATATAAATGATGVFAARSDGSLGGNDGEIRQGTRNADDGWKAELLQAAVRKFAAENIAGSPGQTRAVQQQQQQQQEQQQEAWKASPQLSDMRHALQVAALRGIPSPSAGTTSKSSGSTSTNNSSPAGKSSPIRPQPQQHHLWHVDHTRCMANLGYGPHADPLAASSAEPYQHQHKHRQHQHQHQLFSVYVHTPAGVLLPGSSVLSGCELPVRLNTTRGYAQHVLAEAAALLLAAALTDPLNTKFVLVSDTSIPLYTPQVSTTLSVTGQAPRVDAWNFKCLADHKALKA
jgi:hypothetical protein